jgi:hypothetical protein
MWTLIIGFLIISFICGIASAINENFGKIMVVLGVWIGFPILFFAYIWNNY